MKTNDKQQTTNNKRQNILFGNSGQTPHRASRYFLCLARNLKKYSLTFFGWFNLLELWIFKKARVRATAADLVTGQAMLILVLILGSTMLGVASIAGYVSLQEIRSSIDIVDSTKAIYAADSGVDWCFYQKFGPTGSSTTPCVTSYDLGNGSSVSVTEQGKEVKSIGTANRSSRAFGIFLDQFGL